MPDVHVPGTAVSVDPTFNVPDTVGTGAVKTPKTAVVATDVFDAVTYPDFDPVTFTVIVLPSCADVSLNVDAVAPVIATPLAYQT